MNEAVAYEEWRPVVGYEGFYSVSDQGNVRSEPRIARHHTGRPSHRAGKRLKQIDDSRGYLQVGLSKDGKVAIRKVSHLVAEAFLGPRQSGMEVCHNDGASKNNCAANLRYDTPKSNQNDRRKHGTMISGEACAFAKLTVSDVHDIRNATEKQKAIAMRFNITQPAVSMIRSGARWSDTP